MSSLRVLLPTVGCCLFSLQIALAIAGDLDHPSLAFPPNSALREPALAALSDKAFKFLHGNFLNGHTSLQYAGDAASLNLLLSRLAECQGAKVNVTFSKAESEAAWTVDHNGTADSTAFSIIVNTSKIDEHAVHAPKGTK
jgi:hypothetical protein